MTGTRLITCAALIVALAACSDGETPEDQPGAGPDSATTVGDDQEPPPEESAETTVGPPDDAAATTPVPSGDSETTSEDAASTDPCDAGEQAEWLDLEGDGTPDAYQLGAGDAAVILLHQNDGRACNWVPFAETLAAEGYAVLVPAMRPGDWPQPIISLGAEHLRGQGAEHLALVGASMGGTYAIAATPELDAPPDLIVAVSAPDFYRGSSARDVVGDLDLPILFVVAEHDTGLVPEAESLAEAAADPELVIFPGAAHGIRLLDTDPDAAQTVLDALHEHLQTSG